MKKSVYICITESLCCTAEIHIVNQIYFNSIFKYAYFLQKKKKILHRAPFCCLLFLVIFLSTIPCLLLLPHHSSILAAQSCFSAFLNVFMFNILGPSVQFSSVAQSCPTLRPHESQHARPPCPSPTPGVYSSPCLSSQ